MSKVEELKKSGEEIYTRMRRYNPKGGQPHKTYSITPLGKRFNAGEFIKVQPKLARYLEGIYPKKDISRPPLFEFFTRSEYEAVKKHEVQEERRKRHAELLGEFYTPKKMEPPRMKLPTREEIGENEDGITENEELLSLKEEVKKEENPLSSISEEDAKTEIVTPPAVKEEFEEGINPEEEEDFEFEDFG